MLDASKCDGALTGQFTITCYICGMSSSWNWAQRVHSRCHRSAAPHFPFLLQLSPAKGAVLGDDGSTYLCSFCHALLVTQWNKYERQGTCPSQRQYNISNFLCAVCGVQTYRRRVRALPFEKFPFLWTQRHSGGLTLINSALAVVCLDCSETLWAQSAEYDRWGLPGHKRHFNWMAKPPPPEDSVESTVARLPSGDMQIPRCSIVEPATISPKIDKEPVFSANKTRNPFKTRAERTFRPDKNESTVWSKSPTCFVPNQASEKGCRKSAAGLYPKDVGLAKVDEVPKAVAGPMGPHPTLDLLRCQCKSCSGRMSHSSGGSVGSLPLPEESSFLSGLSSPQTSFGVPVKPVQSKMPQHFAWPSSTASAKSPPVGPMKCLLPKKRKWQMFVKSSQEFVSPEEHKIFKFSIENSRLEGVDCCHQKKEIKYSLVEVLCDGNQNADDALQRTGSPHSHSLTTADSSRNFKASHSDLKGTHKALTCSWSTANVGIKKLFQSTYADSGGSLKEKIAIRPSVIKCVPKRDASRTVIGITDRRAKGLKLFMEN